MTKLLTILVLAVLGFVAVGNWAQAEARPPGVTGDGRTDDTAALQGALDAVGKEGGDVYLPPGQYRIGGSLTVPTGVALRGSWEAPHHGAWNKGTTLLLTGGRGQEDGPPAITLRQSSALRGVTMLWPDQRADNIVAYPWAVHGVGMHDTVENVTLVNAYQGIKIGQPSSELHLIRSVYGCVLRRGIFIDSTTDIGRLEDIHFNTHYWMRSGYPPIETGDPDKNVPVYTMKNLEAFIFGRSDWEYVLNTFVWGARIGYHFIKTPDGSCNGQFLGIGADACNQAVLVDAIQPIGLQITNAEFTAFVGPDCAGVVVSPGAVGALQLVNCNFWGTPHGAVQIHGDVQMSLTGCHFADPVTPAAIVADNGHLSLTGCSFAASGPAVALHPGTQAAVILGCLQSGGLNVENGIGDAAVIGMNEGPRVLPAKILAFYQFWGGSPQAADFRDGGWYGAEPAEDAPASIRSADGTACWTNGDASLRLPVKPNTPYTLRVWLIARPGAPPEILSVVGGSSLPIKAGDAQCLTVPIRAVLTGSGQVRVRFQGDPWSPSVLNPGDGDTRQLGVRLYRVSMQAKGTLEPASELSR